MKRLLLSDPHHSGSPFLTATATTAVALPIGDATQASPLKKERVVLITNRTTPKKESWASSNRKERLPSNWTALRTTVLKRDNYKCQLQLPGCSVIATDVDHRIRGDNHDTSNLQAACSKCHAKKSSSEGGRARAALANRKRQLRYRPTERHPGRR